MLGQDAQSTISAVATQAVKGSIAHESGSRFLRLQSLQEDVYFVAVRDLEEGRIVASEASAVPLEMWPKGRRMIRRFLPGSGRV